MESTKSQTWYKNFKIISTINYNTLFLYWNSGLSQTYKNIQGNLEKRMHFSFYEHVLDSHLVSVSLLIIVVRMCIMFRICHYHRFNLVDNLFCTLLSLYIWCLYSKYYSINGNLVFSSIRGVLVFSIKDNVMFNLIVELRFFYILNLGTCIRPW